MAIDFQRRELLPFIRRLGEQRQFLQVLAGPRQVGKTTLVRQALAALRERSEGLALAQHSASADNAGLQVSSWLATQWETARVLARQRGACVLVLDEIQKLPR